VKPILAICILIALSSAPALSQTPAGADVFKYYVGTWSCLGGPTETPAVKANITAVMNDGLLTQHVSVPVQAGMTAAFSQTYTVAYSPVTKVYNQVQIDNFGGWSISKASPWTGNTEEWADVTTADGKLGRGETVRTDQNHYTVTGYASATATAPNFKATCERSAM
jgi:hypothetical protein